MRFMVMAIPEGSGSATPTGAPSAEAVARMAEYNRSLQQAGVLLALDGLFPPSTGARITYTDGTPTVSDGPWTPSSDAIGGYWILQVRSREEAIEWARRAPMAANAVIEVRQIRELSDGPDDVRRAAGGLEPRPPYPQPYARRP
jgi:hypothetical protein